MLLAISLFDISSPPLSYFAQGLSARHIVSTLFGKEHLVIGAYTTTRIFHISMRGKPYAIILLLFGRPEVADVSLRLRPASKPNTYRAISLTSMRERCFLAWFSGHDFAVTHLIEFIDYYRTYIAILYIYAGQLFSCMLFTVLNSSILIIFAWEHNVILASHFSYFHFACQPTTLQCFSLRHCHDWHESSTWHERLPAQWR